MNKKDDFIKELEDTFKYDIEMPEGLSKSNMIKKLKNQRVAERKKSFRILPKIVSAAAVMTIIAVAAVAVGLKSEFIPVDSATTVGETATVPASSAEAEETGVSETKDESDSEKKLKIAKSEEDLKNHFVKLYTEGKIYNYVDSFIESAYSVGEVIFDGVASADSADSVESVNDAMSPTMAASQSVTGVKESEASFGKTNLQVADVDEGDIIKNDGKYLYIVNSPGYSRSKYISKSTLTIVEASTMTKVYSGGIQVSDSEIKETETDEEINKSMAIEDIYVNGNILTAICSYNKKTYAVVYDITQRHAPSEIRRVDQDGSYVSSRMVDGILYTVTDYTVSGSSAKEIEENAIPEVNCDCLLYSSCYIVDEESTGYIVLSAFDTKENDGEVSAISILGDGCEIYSTSSTLYVYASDYGEGDDIVHTDIYAFSIDKTNISHKATGRIDGELHNQYSLDEYGGNLRVASCYYDFRSNKDVSCVFVLDSSLNKIGEITDLKEDEQVKAVRFMGDTGYVVTFRNTDPLFIIDFSDPKNPTVTGELKIPGYSTYIHPLSDGYLVGIGYDGTEENANLNKVKVSVFDVRDKSAPKETDTFVIENAYSLVNEDPKAFFIYAERNMIGIPVSYYDNDNTIKGIQTLTIEEGKITSNKGFVHYAGSTSGYYDTVYGSYAYYYTEIFRGTYIGDSLFTISNTEVIEHNLDSGEKIRSCSIASDIKNENIVSYGVEGDNMITVQTTTPPMATE